MRWVFQIAIFAAIVFLIYSLVKYILSPKRKLELAHEHKKYYFLDYEDNVRKNFLITYKGALFEGEKYLGTTDHAFEVVSIFVWPKSVPSLKGFVRDDFMFIERKITEIYPNANIDWKNPIQDFLNKTTSPDEQF